MKELLLNIDDKSKKFIMAVGDASILAYKGFIGIFKPPFNFNLIIKEADNIGVKSLIVVCIIALFAGMVLALQTIYGLRYYGAELYVGSVVSLSMVREMAPVLASIMVGGRMGSGIAAEIGSMQVTEQIDAIRALGANPIKKLVSPKIFAAIFVVPLLTVAADIVGVFGGMIIAMLELNVGYQYYLNTVWWTIGISDFCSGIGKTAFFGFIIALIGCYFGLNTTGGTTGVGRSTTITVVTIALLIIISDFFLTKLFFLVF
ncbi:MAG: ABC-type transport system permease protein [Candidatus Scalindua rubra]|uniref:ABC-type transport system permease protein n=1 Tax=Candidatus Scalindua rubra TaxID=1872076 RepID=A0A1E3XED1_9BACT|nr:MAG: ABC-type transport system permease protein [Candidatus Scalindua rubra]